MSGVMSRDLVVRLMAQSNGFENGMKSAAASADVFARELETMEAKQAKAAEQAARMRAQAYTKVGTTALVAGAVVAAGFGLAARASMAFEKQMSEVGAVSGANADQLHKLSDAALQAGKVTVFSAREAAQGEAELAKAGVKVKDILGGGLIGALNLASAGQLSVGEAASIAATSMTQFNLKGKDVGHIADLLAAGSNKALGSVSDLGVALKYVGPVAAQMGVSIDETVGTLAELAQNGLLADQAGTGLRGVLSSLTSPSKLATAEMKKLGINVFDSQGKFLGFAGVAGQLKSALGGLTEKQRSFALGQIFGNQQITAARVLFKGGAEDVKRWTDEVNQNGYAADLAHQKMDNLAGDLENLKGSLETALIKSGTSANGVLRDMAQAANAVVGAYISLPGPAQAALTAATGVTGAVLIVGGTALIAVPKVMAFDVALKKLTGDAIGAKEAMLGVGKVGAAVGIVLAAGLGVDQLTRHFEKTPPTVNALTSSLLDFLQTGEVTRDMAVVVGNGFADLSSKIKAARENRLESFVNPWQHMPNQIDDARHAVDALDKSLAGLVQSGNQDAAARLFAEIKSHAKGISSSELDKAFNDYKDALAGVAVESKLAASGVTKLGTAEESTASKITSAVHALKSQADALRASYDPVFAMQKALIDHANAQKAATDAVHKHGRRSAEAKQAQWDLLQSTVDLSGAAIGLRQAVVTGADSYAKSRVQLDQWVKQGLITKAQSDVMADGIKKVTERANDLTKQPIVAHVDAPNLTPVSRMLDGVIAKLDRIDGRDATFTVNGVMTGAAVAAKHDRIDGKASGGLLRGPGTATSDSMMIRASNGEYVMRAAAVQAIGVQNLDRWNRIPGYADGGLVYASGSRTMAGGQNVEQLQMWQSLLASAPAAASGRGGFRDLVVQTQQANADAADIVEEAVFAARMGRL
jgi:TP901 family phage tail tape measure protein